ncbi:hypothetical protein OIU84_008721 [Salix udensis]|uniref:SelT-like protein n=1 Tax=Salix udensis TaxID=889485 RepID=A0AAD6JQ00_9ROSI|nr:hypothetical protein OIU84_008721 [Salix udensis]
MDRAQILLVGLPLFLLCTDLIHLFTPPPPKPHHPHHHPHPHHHHHHQQPPVAAHETPGSPTQKPVVGGIGLGSTVRIDFCASCSYRGNAATMKKMLETQFPGVDVVLVNYPPSLPKRVAAKLVPVFQVGVMGIVLGGEQIFPMIGLMAPPPCPSSNPLGRLKFIAMMSWFSPKLMEARFPGEIELKDLVGRRLANSGISDILL